MQDICSRLAEPGNPADKGALLREWVRLGGTGAIPNLGTTLASDIELRRFGLELVDRHADVPRLRIRDDSYSQLPNSLANQLRTALYLDPQLRRLEDLVAGDGALLRLTNFTRYRNESQKAAVRAALAMPAGSALLATLATGTGKSLVFHLRTMFSRECAPPSSRPSAAVIVPTTSLALDQAISAQNFPALKNSAALTAANNGHSREELLAAFQRGEAPLLFMSPEMAFGSAREPLLEMSLPLDDPQRPLAARGHLDTVYIDESHIIASWGRTFRPDFQRLPTLIRELRQRNPALRVVLLSATIDSETQDLLHTQYAPSNRSLWLSIAEGAPRREFDFVSERFESREARRSAVIELLNFVPRPALIYTTQIEDADELLTLGQKAGFSRIRGFTGETTASERLQIINEWRQGEVDIVVATSAFGMGVDHQNVRAVVHACLPENAARYYQEIGRGGRDGHQALAVLLWTNEDLRLATRLAVGQTMTLRTAQQRWPALLRSREQRVERQHTIQSFDLDSAGRHITNEYTGRRNANWNRSLLIQLQRFGALEIHPSAEDATRWSVSIRSGAEDLLDERRFESVLEGFFAEREREEEYAYHQVRDFVELWDHASECVLQRLFQVVDVAGLHVTRCGRCPPCRASGIFPRSPILQYVRSPTWPAREASPTVPGILQIPPNELLPVAPWVDALLTRGVEQFIAPERIADAIATHLARHEQKPGWVIPLERTTRVESPFEPLPVPSAVVVPEEDGTTTEALHTWSQTWHRLGGEVRWWVAAPQATMADPQRLFADNASMSQAVSLSHLNDTTQ